MSTAGHELRMPAVRTAVSRLRPRSTWSVAAASLLFVLCAGGRPAKACLGGCGLGFGMPGLGYGGFGGGLYPGGMGLGYGGGGGLGCGCAPALGCGGFGGCGGRRARPRSSCSTFALQASAALASALSAVAHILATVAAASSASDRCDGAQRRSQLVNASRSAASCPLRKSWRRVIANSSCFDLTALPRSQHCASDAFFSDFMLHKSTLTRRVAFIRRPIDYH